MVLKEKSMKANEKSTAIELKLKEFGRMNNQEILAHFETSMQGLSCIEIEKKQEEYGKNIIDIKNNKTILNRLREAFLNPFNIVLILVAIITFITDVIISTPKDYLTFTLILSTVFISAIISLFQQTSSDKAVQKLKKMISNKIEIIRDGIRENIDVEEIVPGDIVKLSS